MFPWDVLEMRTTLNIDDDLLAAVKEMAATGRKSVGEVISALSRTAMRPLLPNAGPAMAYLCFRCVRARRG